MKHGHGVSEDERVSVNICEHSVSIIGFEKKPMCEERKKRLIGHSFRKTCK